MHTKTIGDVSEAMVTANLLQRGFVVLKPLGDNQRYDIAVEWGGKFYRIAPMSPADKTPIENADASQPFDGADSSGKSAR